MAIYITDKDGNDQHFDTIEEFERAMIFMTRLGGNKPPQDLVDEVKERDSEALEKERLTDFIIGKAKDGGMHEIVLAQGKPINFFGDDNKESDDDKISVGDSDSEEREFKFKVGDKVRVVDNSTFGLEEGSVATVVEIDPTDRDITYLIKEEKEDSLPFYHRESDLELVEDEEDMEFYNGDIVYVTDTIENPYSKYNVHKGLAEIKNGSVFENSLICQEGVAINFKTDNIDHRDKVRLVCRAEDRKCKDYGDK